MKFLAAPFDPAQTNLGPDFQGHDITAVFEAIKDSKALKEKSEYETTAEYEARRASFSGQPLGEVGYFRRNHLVPVPRVASLE